jgi:hypothetical protein
MRVTGGWSCRPDRGPDAQRPVGFEGVLFPLPFSRVALCGVLRGDEGLGGAEKAKLFALALRIMQEDAPDLEIEDRSVVKERIGRAFAPLIVGRAFEMIDPPAKLKAVGERT